MTFRLTTLCLLAAAWPLLAEAPAPPVITPDLSALPAHGWEIANREPAAVIEDGRPAVRFDERRGPGIALFEGLELANGEIEFDAKGRDIDQRSFVGVVFRAAGVDSYEAVYFRPFNFRSADPVRRAHAVQYEKEPEFPWKRLREEHPGRYEHAVEPAPDPNGWFHARIVVRDRRVRVFVNGAATPSLDIETVSEPRAGRVGFWIGDESPGLFANFVVRTDQER